MVATCANSNCTATFRYLREGRLFAVQPSVSSRPGADLSPATRGPRFFWLCESCSRAMTIAVGPNAAVRVVRKSIVGRASPSIAETSP